TRSRRRAPRRARRARAPRAPARAGRSALGPRSLHSFHERLDRSVEWRRHAALLAEADDAAVEVVDLRLPPRLDVLEHRRLVAVGDLELRTVVEQLRGIGIELDALRR